MPANFLAVRTALVESKKCIMANLEAVKATKLAIIASKFYKPLATFAAVAEKVLKKTKEALEFQDEKIAFPVNLATIVPPKPATIATKWTAGFVYMMEGVLKKNYQKVDKVDKKMKKVEGYAKKATTAAAKAKKMCELVVTYAPKAPAPGPARADEMATSMTNLADPIVDFLKSMNANTKNMYENIATVATAVETAKKPIDLYKFAICKPKAALQKILDIIKPFLVEFAKSRCLPCTATKAINSARVCIPAVWVPATYGPDIPATYAPFGGPKLTDAKKGAKLTNRRKVTDEKCTPAVNIPSITVPPGVNCVNNKFCTSAQKVLEGADALFKALTAPIEAALKPLTDAAAAFVPDVPMPNIDFGLPDFSALDTINFDFEIESLTKFADMTLNVDMNLLTEANIIRTLGDCTIPQFIRPSSIASCANKGLADTPAGNAMLAEMNALEVITTQEKATIPAAVTAVAPISVPVAPIFDPTCVDDDEMCAEWASNGECDKNPDNMHVNCKKSCSTCKKVVAPTAKDAATTAKSTVVKYVLTLKTADGSEVMLADFKTWSWYGKWKEEIITKFVLENALKAGSVVIDSITQGSLIINFKVSGTAEEVAMVENKMKDPAALSRLANDFADLGSALDETTSYTGTGTATTTGATTPAATGGAGAGGAIAAVIIILLLIIIVVGGMLYMQKKGMGPFAAGGKLAKYAQKGGAKTAAGGAKTSPMQSADPVVKNPAAAADVAAVATKDTAVAVEVRGYAMSYYPFISTMSYITVNLMFTNTPHTSILYTHFTL